MGVIRFNLCHCGITDEAYAIFSIPALGNIRAGVFLEIWASA